MYCLNSFLLYLSILKAASFCLDNSILKFVLVDFNKRGQTKKSAGEKNISTRQRSDTCRKYFLSEELNEESMTRTKMVRRNSLVHVIFNLHKVRFDLEVKPGNELLLHIRTWLDWKWDQQMLFMLYSHPLGQSLNDFQTY